MKKSSIVTAVIVGSMVGIILAPAANAYSLYPSTDGTATAYQSSSLNFQNFNLASGFSQLVAPFQSFIQSVQSDTMGATIIQSTTLPFMNNGVGSFTVADIQNYMGQLNNWFYGTIGTEIFSWTSSIRAKLSAGIF